MSSAPTVDSLRWRKFPVLDDGFVTLVDVMGSDQAVVQAARVSYGEGTRQVSDDRGLIRYLMRHRHTTPFEMAEIKLLVRVPMDCWRQWIRHRTANVNEYSTRYSLAIDATQATPPSEWRSQASSNRQGSGEPLGADVGERLSASEAEFQARARQLYEERIAAGVAREQARKDLLLSTYTEAYWKVDLHNLLHFLALRMDAHAQHEIRSYATVIGREIVQPLFPLVWEAFVDYRLEAMLLTRSDRKVIQRLTARMAAEGQRMPGRGGRLHGGAGSRLARGWLPLPRAGRMPREVKATRFARGGEVVSDLYANGSPSPGPSLKGERVAVRHRNDARSAAATRRHPAIPLRYGRVVSPLARHRFVAALALNTPRHEIARPTVARPRRQRAPRSRSAFLPECARESLADRRARRQGRRRRSRLGPGHRSAAPSTTVCSSITIDSPCLRERMSMTAPFHAGFVNVGNNVINQFVLAS